MGNCTHCGERAGFLRRKHEQCENVHQRGLVEMAQLALEAASGVDFNADVVRSKLAHIAERSFAREDHITAAIEQGWERAVAEALADGVLTQGEETRLRGFRDKLALADAAEGGPEVLDRAARARLRRDARTAQSLLARIWRSCPTQSTSPYFRYGRSAAY